MIKRTGALLLTAGLAFAGLTACGSSDQEYCDAAKGVSDKVSSIMTSKDGGMDSMASQFQKVADKAPDDVKGDWKTFVSSLKKFDKLADQMNDPEKMGEVAKKMKKVSADLSSSSKAVKTDLRDRCGD